MKLKRSVQSDWCFLSQHREYVDQYMYRSDEKDKFEAGHDTVKCTVFFRHHNDFHLLS